MSIHYAHLCFHGHVIEASSMWININEDVTSSEENHGSEGKKQWSRGVTVSSIESSFGNRSILFLSPRSLLLSFINNASLAYMCTTAHTTVPLLPPSPKNSTGQPFFIRVPAWRIRQTPAKSVGTAGTNDEWGVRSHIGFRSPTQLWDVLCVKPFSLPLSNVNLKRVPQE